MCEGDIQSESRREIKAGLVYRHILICMQHVFSAVFSMPQMQVLLLEVSGIFLGKHFHQRLVSADVELIGVNRGS